MLSTFTKEEKTTLFLGLGLVVVAIIVDSYMRNKSKANESNYVMPRGYFQPITTTTTISPTPEAMVSRTPTRPTPIPEGEVTSPVPQAMVGRVPTRPAPIIEGETSRTPAYPMPYPYPYPLPYGAMPYAIIPPLPSINSSAPIETAKQVCYKNVVLIGDKEATCFQTREDYVKFLKKTYNTLVDSYNDALYTLALGRAFKITKAMRKVKNDLTNESIII